MFLFVFFNQSRLQQFHFFSLIYLVDQVIPMVICEPVSTTVTCGTTIYNTEIKTAQLSSIKQSTEVLHRS